MSTKQIIESFQAWRQARRRMVLATVTETAGSTYSKAGHRIVIADTGDYQGLVSGGCLEGDLASHAREVGERGEARLVTYDLRGEDDELFGLGIGCNGLLRILLQPLEPEAGYEPFATLARLQLEGRPARYAVVVESAHAALKPGATLIAAGSERRLSGVPASAEPVLESALPAAAPDGGTALETVALEGQAIRLLAGRSRPLPRLLVLGAGLDALPLIQMAEQLGWLVTVADHRPANFARAALRGAARTVCAPASELAAEIDLAEFDAAVVMSHHLASDRAYLEQLAASPVPYVGLLGPAARKARLLGELGDAAAPLEGRLHGPAGLDLPARSPEAIAIAILAQILAQEES